MSRRLSPLIPLLVVVAGCNGAPSAEPLADDVGPVSEEAVVVVDDDVFVDDDLVVEAGTEVVWRWEGRAAHDVVGDGFDSGVQASGEFRHTFTDEGSYPYVCSLHPGMDGTVHVVGG